MIPAPRLSVKSSPLTPEEIEQAAVEWIGAQECRRIAAERIGRLWSDASLAIWAEAWADRLIADVLHRNGSSGHGSTGRAGVPGPGGGRMELTLRTKAEINRQTPQGEQLPADARYVTFTPEHMEDWPNVKKFDRLAFVTRDQGLIDRIAHGKAYLVKITDEEQ